MANPFAAFIGWLLSDSPHDFIIFILKSIKALKSIGSPMIFIPKFWNCSIDMWFSSWNPLKSIPKSKTFLELGQGAAQRLGRTKVGGSQMFQGGGSWGVHPFFFDECY